MPVNHWIERAAEYDPDYLLEFVLMDIGVGTSEHLQSFLGVDRKKISNLVEKSRKYNSCTDEKTQTKEERDLQVRLVNKHYYELGINGGKLVEYLTDSKYRKQNIPFEKIPPILAPSDRILEILDANDVFLRLTRSGVDRVKIKWAGYLEADLVLYDRLVKKLSGLSYSEMVLFSLPQPTSVFVLNDKYGFWLQVDDGISDPEKLKDVMVKYHAFYHVSNDNKPLLWITERKELLEKLWLDASYKYRGFSYFDTKPNCVFFSPGEETDFILQWDLENNIDEQKLNFQF